MRRRTQTTSKNFSEDMLNEGDIQVLNDIPGMIHGIPVTVEPPAQCRQQACCSSRDKRQLDMNSSQRVMKERCRNLGLHVAGDKWTVLARIMAEESKLVTCAERDAVRSSQMCKRD